MPTQSFHQEWSYAMLTETDVERPFCINAPRRPARMAPWLANSLENLLCFSQLNKLYQAVRQEQTPQAFLAASLRLLNLQVKVTPEDLAGIPPTGPAVMVANHPFGAIEGMLLAHVLLGVRPDVKFMANYLLGQIPQMRDLCIFVDPFATPRSTHANIRGLKEALTCLQQGQLLVIFPAGEVSHIDLRTRQVTDPPWNENVARLIRRAQVPVLPAYFHGRNGAGFQLAGIVHPHLRTALLPRELINKRNRTVEVRLGSLLAAQHLATFATASDLITYLRQRTYALASRHSSYRHIQPRLALPLPSKPALVAPIIAPLPPARLQSELDQLPAEQMLGQMNELVVYQATAAQIPQVLTEIGRLREIAFRATGEGTGKALDLDEFDRHYLHLLVWNQAKQEVVGAYRLGLTDQIVQAHGMKGLYTNSLFHYAPDFLAKISPALELGRSFVRPEYQRAYAPLLLLWRGIGQFVMRNPAYKTLFGPVSISNSYTSLSRELLMTFLRTHYHHAALARLVRPRNPLPHKRAGAVNPATLSRLLSDLDDLSGIIQDVETDRKGVPILIKQYLKMGASVLAFNVDPQFNNALDALVLADLTQTEPRVLLRYVDKAQLGAFFAYHQPRAAALEDTDAQHG